MLAGNTRLAQTATQTQIHPAVRLVPLGNNVLKRPVLALRLVPLLKALAYRTRRTATNARTATGTPAKYVVAVRTLVRRQLNIQHDRSQTMRNATLRNQTARQAKRPQPGNKRHMTLRPAGTQMRYSRLVVVMQKRCNRLHATFLKPTAKVNTQVLGRYVPKRTDASPMQRRTFRLLAIRNSRLMAVRVRPTHNRLGDTVTSPRRHRLLGRPMTLPYHCLVTHEPLVVSASDPYRRLIEKRIRSSRKKQMTYRLFQFLASNAHVISSI